MVAGGQRLCHRGPTAGDGAVKRLSQRGATGLPRLWFDGGWDLLEARVRTVG